MKAAVYYGARDVRVDEVQAPEGLQGPHDVLLETKWCGICGTDLHEYAAGPIVIPAESHPLTGARLPQILGHEFSADVLAIGPQVTNVRVGDRVSVMPLLYCGVWKGAASGLATWSWWRAGGRLAVSPCWPPFRPARPVCSCRSPTRDGGHSAERWEPARCSIRPRPTWRRRSRSAPRGWGPTSAWSVRETKERSTPASRRAVPRAP